MVVNKIKEHLDNPPMDHAADDRDMPSLPPERSVSVQCTIVQAAWMPQFSFVLLLAMYLMPSSAVMGDSHCFIVAN